MVESIGMQSLLGFERGIPAFRSEAPFECDPGISTPLRRYGLSTPLKRTVFFSFLFFSSLKRIGAGAGHVIAVLVFDSCGRRSEEG